jgi:hypothetical protein
VLKLFHREDGQAVDWPVIAETLLLEAFHALDQMPHSPRMRKLLLRVEGGAYARLTAIPDDPYRMLGLNLSRRSRTSMVRSVISAMDQDRPSEDFPESPAQGIVTRRAEAASWRLRALQ